MMTHELDESLPQGLDLTLDDGPGPARRLTSSQSLTLITGALDVWEAARVPAAPSVPRARPGATRVAWLVAAASMLVAVGSVAAMTIVLTRPTQPEEPVMTLPAAPTTSAPAPEPELVPEEPEEIAPEPPSNEADPMVIPEGDNEEPSRRRHVRRAPRNAEDLLAEANTLRAAGRWREAEATYARVPREHPDSFSAYVAQVAAGDVRLAHLRDPRGALRLYRRAIASRPRGPLDAEAREGVARSLRRLGDRAGERDALRALMIAHPSTPAATRARARLAEMESSD